MKNRIKELRKGCGWTQAELAEAVDTSTGQVARLESGIRRLDTEWMERLAEAFKCDPIEVLIVPALINTSLFHGCGAEVDKALQVMEINDLSKNEYAEMLVFAYNKAVELGGGMPKVDKSFIQETLQNIREIA